MMNQVSEMIQKGQKHKNKDSKNTKDESNIELQSHMAL